MFSDFNLLAKLRTKRAFDCVDKNDTKKLLRCIEKGFDVSTKRRARITPFTMDFEETVSSRALSNHNWPMLKALIEFVGSGEKLMARDFKPGSLGNYRLFVLVPAGPQLWPDLAEKTHEDSPMHFCIWHLFKPIEGREPLSKSRLEELFGDPGVNGESDLRCFFRNCEALEQRVVLGGVLNPVKENKTKGFLRKM